VLAECSDRMRPDGRRESEGGHHQLTDDKDVRTICQRLEIVIPFDAQAVVRPSSATPV
jgi:hypothetical protein